MTRQLTRQRRQERYEWLRENIADVAAAGHDVDPEDVAELPEAHRGAVRAIVQHAAALHEEGNQQDALTYAREAIFDLETQIGLRWAPPHAEGPSREIVDAIRGKF